MTRTKTIARSRKRKKVKNPPSETDNDVDEVRLAKVRKESKEAEETQVCAGCCGFLVQHNQHREKNQCVVDEVTALLDAYNTCEKKSFDFQFRDTRYDGYVFIESNIKYPWEAVYKMNTHIRSASSEEVKFCRYVHPVTTCMSTYEDMIDTVKEVVANAVEDKEDTECFSYSVVWKGPNTHKEQLCKELEEFLTTQELAHTVIAPGDGKQPDMDVKVFIMGKISYISCSPHVVVKETVSKENVKPCMKFAMRGVLVVFANKFKRKSVSKEAIYVLSQYSKKLSAIDDGGDVVCHFTNIPLTPTAYGAKRHLFIETNHPDPSDLLNKLFVEMLETGMPQVLKCMRLLPVSITCKLNSEDIVKTVKEMIPQSLSIHEDGDEEAKKEESFNYFIEWGMGGDGVDRELVEREVNAMPYKLLMSDDEESSKKTNVVIMIRQLAHVCCIGLLNNYKQSGKYRINTTTTTTTTPGHTTDVDSIQDNEVETNAIQPGKRGFLFNFSQSTRAPNSAEVSMEILKEYAQKVLPVETVSECHFEVLGETNTKSHVFIEAPDKLDDPSLLLDAVYEDWIGANGEKAAFCTGFTPVNMTGKGDAQQIITTLKEVTRPIFVDQVETKALKYFLQWRKLNTFPGNKAKGLALKQTVENEMKKYLTSTVAHVELESAMLCEVDVVIRICFQGPVHLISVLPNYKRFKGYNLEFIVKDALAEKVL